MIKKLNIKRRKQSYFESHSLHIFATGILMMVAIVTSTALSVVTRFQTPTIASIQSENTNYFVAANVVSDNVSVSNALKSVSIKVDGSNTIETYQSLRLTALGEFVSGTIPIKARWYAKAVGSPDIELAQCAQREQCEFSTDAPGSIEINAVSSGKIGRTVISVIDSQNRGFVDTVPDWATSSISKLQGLGIIRGYEDGRFGAGDSLTRGQVMVLFTRVLSQANLDSPPRPCSQTSALVPPEHYAFDAFCLFDSRGWETGWSVSPDEPMTRGETAAYVNRVFGPSMLNALGVSQGALLSGGQYFTDVFTDDWYFYDTAVAKTTGIMTGNPDGSFSAMGILNRAEGAMVVDRLIMTIEQLDIEQL